MDALNPLSGLGAQIAGLLGVVVAALLAAWRIRRGAVREDRGQQAIETLRRTDAGRAAADEARAKMGEGKTPDEILRGNDGRWRK